MEDQGGAWGSEVWSGVGKTKRIDDTRAAKEVKGQGAAEGPLVHGETMVRQEELSDYGRTEMMKDHSGAKGSKGPVRESEG